MKWTIIILRAVGAWGPSNPHLTGIGRDPSPRPAAEGGEAGLRMTVERDQDDR